MSTLSIETKKISELNAASAVSGNDTFIVDTTANGTQKLTFSALVSSLEATDNNKLVQSIKKDMQFALGFVAYNNEVTLSNLLTAIRSGDPFAYNLGDYLTINSKKWVVIEKNYYSPIVTSTPHALLMMYDCIDTTGQMYNSTATNAGGYGSSALKTYLEGTFWNSLPSEFRSAIATVNNIRESTKTSAPYSQRKIQIPNIKQIAGTSEYAESERAFYQRFLCAQNALFLYGADHKDFWLSTPDANNNSNFGIFVAASLSASSLAANNARCIRPFVVVK